MIRSRNRARGWKASGGSAPAFAPTDIAGLQLWLDANDAVSQWNDKSGNGYHATQGTGANQPITNSVTVNSKNAISFNGTSHTLALPSGLYSLPTANSTVFVVLRKQTTTSGAIHSAIDATNRYRTLVSSDTLIQGASGPAGTTSNVTNTSDFLSPHTTILSVGSTTFFISYDGNAIVGANQTKTSFTATSFFIGSQGGSANFQPMHLCEFIIYNSQLSSTDLNKLGAYAVSKWGITWTNF